MESVYWIANRYCIPFLLIVLNNGGWNAPKVSTLLVHREGLASKSNRRGESNSLIGITDAKCCTQDLNLSFEPSPDYTGIAAAAGNAWSARVKHPDELGAVITDGAESVKGGRSAVIEVA